MKAIEYSPSFHKSSMHVFCSFQDKPAASSLLQSIYNEVLWCAFDCWNIKLCVISTLKPFQSTSSNTPQCFVYFPEQEVLCIRFSACLSNAPVRTERCLVLLSSYSRKKKKKKRWTWIWDRNLCSMKVTGGSK